MNEQRIETNESPHIVISDCGGQVVVQSWRQTAVSIQGPSFTTAQNGAIRITSQDDLFLAVPVQTSLSLGVVAGNVTLKHLEGGVTGDDLQGKVILNNVDAVQIDRIGLALTAKNLNGTLDVGEANGAVSLHRVSEVKIGAVRGSAVVEYANGSVELGQVEGKLELKSISGDVLAANGRADVVLQNLGGNNSLPSVVGDIWLVGGLRSGEQTFVSEKTIYVYWPEDAPLRLFANAPRIDNTLPLSNKNETREGDRVILSGHIEEGKTALTLKSARRIALKPLGSEPPRFSPDEFAAPQEPVDDLTQKVRAAVRAVLTGSSDMAGLEERLVTAVVAALADLERPGVTEITEKAGGETAVVAPESQTESQTHILQLVRDGLISIEQANLLLEALKI